MTNTQSVIVGLVLLVGSILILGNFAINKLIPSDTKRIGMVDISNGLANYWSASADEQLYSALAILDQPKSFYDLKATRSLLVGVGAALAIGIGVVAVTGNWVGGCLVCIAGLAIAIPLSVSLSKATILSLATKEREVYRSILAMYLMVMAVELRSHPVEIALQDMVDVTYSPVAGRITTEVQRLLDTASASVAQGDTQKDPSLGQALCDLGKAWGIMELDTVGEVMKGMVFTPEALSSMILGQAAAIKREALASYAKKLEAQRPKLAAFSLLQIMPLLVFIVIPVMSMFGKTGI